MKKVIYTVNAYHGNVEKETWFERVSRVNNLKYANKYGADYRHININEVKYDPPHYYKLEAFRNFLESDYDRGLMIDMDVYIEDACPDVWEKFSTGVYMVFDYLMPMKVYKDCSFKIFNDVPKKMYQGDTSHNFIKKEECYEYYNTGVIVFDKAFAKFAIDQLTPLGIEEDGVIKFPDSWAEQGVLNFLIDRHNYSVSEMPRSFNEMTGLTDNRGEFISHFAAPWGRILLSQLEVHPDQASFQRKYLRKGDKIINIGCNTDYSRLEIDFGSLNVDDVRNLPEESKNKEFDCAILGEIPEYINEGDRRKHLKEVFKCIKNNGWIVITVPHDNRPLEEQHFGSHKYTMTDKMIREDAKACGLEVLIHEKIKYVFGIEGSGYLLVNPEMRQKCRDQQELIFNIQNW